MGRKKQVTGHLLSAGEGVHRICEERHATLERFDADEIIELWGTQNTISCTAFMLSKWKESPCNSLQLSDGRGRKVIDRDYAQVDFEPLKGTVLDQSNNACLS